MEYIHVGGSRAPECIIHSQHKTLAHDPPTSVCFQPISCIKRTIFSEVYVPYLTRFRDHFDNLMRGKLTLKCYFHQISFLILEPKKTRDMNNDTK